MNDHLPPTDHDGTAIDWDTEQQQAYLMPELPSLCTIIGWTLAAVAIVALEAAALYYGWVTP